LIDRVWKLNEEIGIPLTSEAIREEDIEAVVTAAIAEGGNYPSPRFISEEECRVILRTIRA
jgi:alcohol dehydrogenase class IV